MTHVANQVGYKVLQLLLWLYQGPLTRDDILARFVESTGKPLSQDAFELYLNTLRQVGCVIKRESAQKGGRYRLMAHTFGPSYEASQWATLSALWDIAEETLNPHEMLVFYRWLLRYFQTLGHGERVRQEKSKFIADKRLAGVLALEDLMFELTQYCDQRQPLDVLYHSGAKGPRQIHIQPESIVFKRGQLYLLAQTALSPEQAMFRLERIYQVRPLPRPIQPENALPQVTIRFLDCAPQALPQWPNCTSVHPVSHNAQQAQAVFSGENPFLLTQQLLASGLRFQVLSPQSFRDQLIQQLKAMEALYTHDEG